jgi:dTDP-glucose 4,6-dehydratase
VAPLVEGADRVIHAAAESFVDRSIGDSRAFVLSNVLGTQVVLEACRELETPLVFVSTDEVYGSNEGEPFREPDPMRPRNPYAASKAGADLLVHSYVVTYGLRASTVRGTNAYGPRQHPEKAIPTFATAALQGRPLPVYGDGSNRREWLYVSDFAAAIATVMDRGEPGGVYNIGGGTEMTNLELAERIWRTWASIARSYRSCRIGPDTISRTGWTGPGSRRSVGRRAHPSPTDSRSRSRGTATTRTGWPRCSRGRRREDPPHRGRGRARPRVLGGLPRASRPRGVHAPGARRRRPPRGDADRLP